MTNIFRLAALAGATALLFSCTEPRQGSLTILSTDDVHGAWFDSTYTDSSVRPSLFAVNSYVDSVRKADGAQNVLLLDAGDCLQGDNAAYYYNYVDTLGEHLFTRLTAYMGYDAVCVGNHDIETGHRVYDKVARQLRSHGIPFLAGNAFRNGSNKTYFPLYKVFRRGGLKALVLGYTNPDIPSWLGEELWSGMHFESLVPLVQNDVDRLKARIRPDVTIVMCHSGSGAGDGSILESQGLDLLKTLRGVDFVVNAHDHRQLTIQNDSICLLNAGNRSKYLTIGKINVAADGTRSRSASLIKVNPAKVDTAMRAAFRKDYLAVKAFSTAEIGALAMDLHTRDAYIGMNDYVNFVHTVQLKGSGAKVSFAAPLTYNGTVRAGILIYNDLFTIYPFENQLFAMNMSGREIKDYLEYSYNTWLSDPGSEHVLRIVESDDPRNNQARWSFVNRSYNFDSAAGLIYTVDVDKPFGQRVNITSFADLSPFESEAMYPVAMTSYRANGGGGLLVHGAGIPKEQLEGRVLGRYPEIREFVYDFVKEYGLIDHETVTPAFIGHWEFAPQSAQERLQSDLSLVFAQ